MSTIDGAFSDLRALTVKNVMIHVGERSIVAPMGVLETGYTLNHQTLRLREDDRYSNKINIARMFLTKVNEEFYQLVEDRDGLHLYLPSVVDADDQHVWKGV